MSRKLIVGNWKMNMLRDEARDLSTALISAAEDKSDKCDVVLAPPYTSIETVAESVKNSAIGLCAQDVSWEISGAYTGEISVEMIKDIGCKWVIIGHSERRHIIGEDYEIIKKKVIMS